MSKYECSLGTFIDPGADAPLQEIPYTHCVHCQAIFPVPSFDPDKKAGRVGRGFCYNCGGFICGEQCIECKPWEKQMDIIDSGRNPTAVTVAVPQGPIWTPGMP